MILEGLVTTCTENGGPHLAPMGPIVLDDFRGFLFRPFPTSTTGQNLLRTREGVFHVTDDAALIAKAALNQATIPTVMVADVVKGWVLAGACRAYEFTITDVDTSQERMHLKAQVVKVHTLREFWGFNRAKHAVVEAAIMATRFHLLNAEEIATAYRTFRITVDKTGGPAEKDAMAFLEAQWAKRNMT